MFLITLYFDQGKQEFGATYKLLFYLSLTQIYRFKNNYANFGHIRLEKTAPFGVELNITIGVRFGPAAAGSLPCIPKAVSFWHWPHSSFKEIAAPLPPHTHTLREAVCNSLTDFPGVQIPGD